VFKIIAGVRLYLQPIIALLRPAETSPRRVIFRWMHGVVGHGAHLLAGWHYLVMSYNAADSFYLLIILPFSHACTSVFQLVLLDFSEPNLCSGQSCFQPSVNK